MSPGTLYQYLADQVAEAHTAMLQEMELIKTKTILADAMASMLMSNGIPSISGGLVGSSRITVWVSAYVERIDHIDIALSRLEMIVESRTVRCPITGTVEIHVQGYPMPLYVSETTPDTAPPCAG